MPVTGILSNLHIDIKPNFLIFVCLITGHQPPTHDIIQPQCQLPVYGYWHNKLIDLKPQFLVFVCLAQVRLRDTRSSICKNSIDMSHKTNNTFMYFWMSLKSEVSFFFQ